MLLPKDFFKFFGASPYKFFEWKISILPKCFFESFIRAISQKNLVWFSLDDFGQRLLKIYCDVSPMIFAINFQKSSSKIIQTPLKPLWNHTVSDHSETTLKPHGFRPLWNHSETTRFQTTLKPLWNHTVSDHSESLWNHTVSDPSETTLKPRGFRPLFSRCFPRWRSTEQSYVRRTVCCLLGSLVYCPNIHCFWRPYAYLVWLPCYGTTKLACQFATPCFVEHFLGCSINGMRTAEP